MSGTADTDEEGGVGKNFTLVHDKGLQAEAELAAWSPDKDMVALATADGHLLLHRLNWQKLWSIQPGLKVTALCWSPDAKILAVGHKDGSVALRDVENGEVKKATRLHDAAVQCLCWTQEDSGLVTTGDVFSYQDRTSQFFPPAPLPPPMPGSVSHAAFEGPAQRRREEEAMGNQQQLSVLCSADAQGGVCLTASGVYLIGRLALREMELEASDWKGSGLNADLWLRLPDASVLQVELSRNLRQLTVVCQGTPHVPFPGNLVATAPSGVLTLAIDTALLSDRRKEVRQVAAQAWHVRELMEVAQASLAAMERHWGDAMASFSEKIRLLSGLLLDHGSFVGPRDELLALLSCGSASSALHQFLASSLGEQGLKRLAKSIDTAALHLHCLLTEHLQPALEETAFRLGELRGLARWRARLQPIGLEEEGVEDALEEAGMALVQSERVLRLTSSVSSQFRMLFVWLMKALRQLNDDTRQSNEQLPAVDTAAVAEFLRTHFERDPIGPHLAPASDREVIDLSGEEQEAMEELAVMGGFSDPNFLQRTLCQQVEALMASCEATFALPMAAVSPALRPCGVALLATQSLADTPLGHLPTSLSYQELTESGEATGKGPIPLPAQQTYLAFQAHAGSSLAGPAPARVLALMRTQEGLGFGRVVEVAALRLVDDLSLVDVAFYRDRKLAMVVDTVATSGARTAGQAYLLLLACDELQFHAVPHQFGPKKGVVPDIFQLCNQRGWVTDVGLEDGKVRALSQCSPVRPLAVSASRGLACVFAGQRRILVFDLEEDEEAGEADE